MTLLDLTDGEYTAETRPMVRWTETGLVASAIPVKPPTEWFTNPRLDRVTPLTVDASGRISGHIATWKQDHIGMAGAIKAPRSKSDYAFFATGVVETAEGKHVNVGQITLTHGHASLEASVSDVVAHYDDTRSGWCDVAVGEDRYGIWAAGSVRPDTDEITMRRARASSVSGDWRPINGSLELVAVCSVNTPGFPIPRARVAAGVPVALVAAGTAEIVEVLVSRPEADAVTAGMLAMDDRMRAMEDQLTSGLLFKREELSEAITAARMARRGEIPVPSADELRDRVFGGPVASQSDVDALRASVYDTAWRDGLDIAATLSEGVQAALRAKVKGAPIVARAGGQWSKDMRANAVKDGAAMKDGSFPIADKADLKRAIQAYGRAKDKTKAKRHIVRRARALGATDALPDDWKK